FRRVLFRSTTWSAPTTGNLRPPDRRWPPSSRTAAGRSAHDRQQRGREPGKSGEDGVEVVARHTQPVGHGGAVLRDRRGGHHLSALQRLLAIEFEQGVLPPHPATGMAAALGGRT